MERTPIAEWSIMRLYVIAWEDILVIRSLSVFLFHVSREYRVFYIFLESIDSELLNIKYNYDRIKFIILLYF